MLPVHTVHRQDGGGGAGALSQHRHGPSTGPPWPTPGRDPALAETHNLIGSAGSILEQVAFLDKAGIDHVCALQLPSDTGAEMLEQIQWLAEEVMKPFNGA